MEIEVKQVSKKKANKKNKGKKLKTQDTDSQLKKVVDKSKAIQKQGKKKKLLNGNVKKVGVKITQKSKNDEMTENVKDTVVVKKKKKGGNKGKKEENGTVHQEEPKNKRKKLKAQNKNAGKQINAKKNKEKMAAGKKNEDNKENADGKDTVKAGKRKRDPEDETDFSSPKKKRIIMKYSRTLLIHFPDSLVVRKEAQARAIAGDSVVEIRFPNVPKGQSKGCCYAVYNSEEEAKQMMKTLEEKEVEGGALKVEYLGDKAEVKQKPSPKEPKELDPLVLYVGELPKSVKHATLTKLFPTASTIRNCTGYKKLVHHAFLTFKTEEEAKKVLEESKGLKVEDSELKINYAYVGKKL